MIAAAPDRLSARRLTRACWKQRSLRCAMITLPHEITGVIPLSYGEMTFALGVERGVRLLWKWGVGSQWRARDGNDENPHPRHCRGSGGGQRCARGGSSGQGEADRICEDLQA